MFQRENAFTVLGCSLCPDEFFSFHVKNENICTWFFPWCLYTVVLLEQFLQLDEEEKSSSQEIRSSSVGRDSKRL